MSEIGEIKKRSLDDVFSYELDFSRWLATNIKSLDELVRWDIDPATVKQEVTKGSLRVDLLVDATDPVTHKSFEVVIENQIDTTDSGHLAAVMIYLASFGAGGAVWIAGEVTQEYVETVQWLNDRCEIDIYLFKIEAISIGNSLPAPMLTRIVGPSSYARGGRAGDPVLAQKLRDWWDRVLPKVRQIHGGWESERPVAVQYKCVSIPEGPDAVSWYINVEEKRSSIGLWIGSSTREEINHYYDQLHEQRNKIEDDFGEELLWEKKSGKKPAFVYWTNPLTIGFDSEPDEQIRAIDDLVAMMNRLVVATRDIVPSLPEFKPSDNDASGD